MSELTSLVTFQTFIVSKHSSIWVPYYDIYFIEYHSLTADALAQIAEAAGTHSLDPNTLAYPGFALVDAPLSAKASASYLKE